MKSVLISIQKPHTDNIFNCRKLVEWRKKPLPLLKHYVYESKKNGGCGKVIGEMEIVRNVPVDIDTVSNALLDIGCVDKDFLLKYCNGNGNVLYANSIANVKIYDKPKELSEFLKPCNKNGNCMYCGKHPNDGGKCTGRIVRPPQSWYYVEDLGE